MNMENLSKSLSILDWAIFASTILLTIAAVLYSDHVKRKMKKSGLEEFLDLLIMGRKLTLPLFITSMVASWYGGIFGVTKIAFEKGIYNFVTQGLFWYLAYFFFALFIVDKIAIYKAVTLPELIGKMFGPKSMRLSAIFNLFNVMPIAYTISLGLFLKAIFGGSLLMHMGWGVLLVTFYSMFGGMRADVFSDFVQFFIMCISVFLVLTFSIYEYGGISFLQQKLPASHFDPMGGQTFWEIMVWGLIAFSTLVDPNFYQRCFATESPKIAKKGIYISIFIWFCFDICTTAGAMYARAVMPEQSSDDAYLIYAMNLLPNGLRGLILGGILATILSTMDTYLIIASSTITYDLAPKFLRAKVWAHHLGMIFVGLISIAIAMLFEGNIKSVWKTLGSYSAACLLFPVLCGYFFPNKIRDTQFVTGCLTGVVGTTYWRNAQHSGFWSNVDEIYIGILSTAFGLLLWKAFILSLRVVYPKRFT